MATSGYVWPPTTVPVCLHKDITDCKLTALPACCACVDKRPMATSYPIYVDGQGMKQTGTRWTKYCWRCKDFYDQLFLAPLPDRFTPVPLSNAAESNMTNNPYLDADGNVSLPSDHPWLTWVSQFEQLRGTVEVVPARYNTTQSRPDMPYPSQGFHSPAAQMRRESRRERRARLQARPPALGTREDVENPDYQSPVAGMFQRAYDRFRSAEVTRRAERALSSITGHGHPNGVVSSGLLPHHPPPQSGQPAMPESRSILHLSSGQSPNHPASPNVANPANIIDRQLTGVGALPGDHDFDGTGPNIIDEQARPRPCRVEDLKVDISCKICTEQKSDILVLPCAHLVMCHWCADLIYQQFRERRRQNPTARNDHACPLCRRPIKQTKRVHLP